MPRARRGPTRKDSLISSSASVCNFQKPFYTWHRQLCISIVRRNATFYSIEISAFEKRGPGKASEERSEGGGAMFGRPNVPSKQATQEKIRSQKNRGRRKPTCTDESSIISLRGYAKKIQQLFGKATHGNATHCKHGHGRRTQKMYRCWSSGGTQLNEQVVVGSAGPFSIPPRGDPSSGEQNCGGFC